MENKKLAFIGGILASVAVIGTASSDIIGLFIEPVILEVDLGTVDPDYQMLDENSPPNKVFFRLMHTHVDEFKITHIKLASKEFSDIQCIDIL